jgi:phosphatidylcholine synthase
MNDDQISTDTSSKQKTAAWAVHAFTTSGAILGFLALIATLNDDRIAAFMWLGLALFVDGIDGTLARKVNVREVIPSFDGATLDNIIDYFTYVVVPAMMIYAFGMVPPGFETVTAAGILAVSCYTFANVGVKTTDYYFSGFPALWNLIVLYFHVLQSSQWVNLAVIIVCAGLTFVPWKYVHPLRVKAWRNFTVPITLIWGATSLRLVLIHPSIEKAQEASPVIFWIWIACSFYFVVISAVRSIGNKD